MDRTVDLSFTGIFYPDCNAPIMENSNDYFSHSFVSFVLTLINNQNIVIDLLWRTLSLSYMKNFIVYEE